MEMLKDKVVFLTGGTSGIGKGALELSCEEGASVAFFARRKELGEEIATSLCNKGYHVKFYQTDVSIREQVEKSFREAFNDFGRCDVLFNNAGLMTFHGKPDERTEYNEAAFKSVIDVDLFGAYYCATEVIQYMRKSGGGSIVNIASIAALVTSTGFCGYPIAKAGALGMTIGFANTYASENIRTNAVLPGYVDTEGMQQDDAPKTEGVDYTQFVPMRRFATPRDIANVMVFLGSDYSSYMNGAKVVVDGGLITNMAD
jgi:NAD(P)-dependent dehydrogenase (short-subunit alcohol dehydrogenase family)